MKCVLYRTLYLHETSKIALANVTREVIQVWREAGIPTIAQQNISTKISRKLLRYDKLKKNYRRRNEKPISNEKSEEILKLLDICKPNLKLSQQYLNFLLDQSTVRELKIKAINSTLVIPRKTIVTKKEVRRSESYGIKDELDSDSEMEIDDVKNDSDFEATLPHYQKAKLLPKQASFLESVLNSMSHLLWIEQNIQDGNWLCSQLLWLDRLVTKYRSYRDQPLSDDGKNIE